MYVEISIQRTVNGEQVVQKASLSENGWQQWGESPERLGETVSFMEALQEAFQEHAPDLCEDEREDEDERD